MTAPIFTTKYPTLYKKFSSENFDYYGITNEKLCPLCELEHGDEESIEGTVHIKPNPILLNVNSVKLR